MDSASNLLAMLFNMILYLKKLIKAIHMLLLAIFQSQIYGKKLLFDLDRGGDSSPVTGH